MSGSVYFTLGFLIGSLTMFFAIRDRFKGWWDK